MDDPGGAAGPALENLAAMEIARQLTWSQQRARTDHYRTNDKVEVAMWCSRPQIDVSPRWRSTPGRTEDLTGLSNLAQ